ncbi:MAG TPA: HAD family acid phosphatase [Jatrophihabitantaceae bacterium]
MPDKSPDQLPDQPATPASRRAWRRPFAMIAAVVAVIAGLVSGGVAISQSTPKHGDSIPNITLVENQIKAYYGDTVVGTDHLPSPTGNYAKEVEGIAGQAQQYLAHQHVKQAHPALVFDVDDTTLNTYNYEIFSGFAYNPTTNAEYVNDERFPAVFGMPGLVNWANSHGYTVFFLTGRPEAQRAGTEGNLAKVGYQAPADTAHLYLKDQTVPWLSFCAPTCTTIQYKSSTRAHIESLGYHIVANFGDQFSDLEGGHADKTFKIPNPMYYLP